jgi:hypothetical protein
MIYRSVSLYALIIIISLIFINAVSAVAQANWTLSAQHEGINVYTRPAPNTKLKAIKVVSTIPATNSQLLASIMDIETCGEWVYHSKKNILIKKISPLDLIYYSELEVPWPCENRDYVVHIQASQNPQTKVITVNSPCIPGYVPQKEKIVRIPHSVGYWTITPLGRNQVRAEYVLEVDPMGTIPAWLINLFATKGPLETFRGLKVHAQQDRYKNIGYPQIAN